MPKKNPKKHDTEEDDGPLPTEHGPHMVPHEEDKKELQRKYLQMQMLQQYLKTMEQEKSMVEQKIIEMQTTLAALENMQKTKEGKEMWSPLGSDCFVQSDLKQTDQVIVGVGAGFYASKPIPDAKEVLVSRQNELEKIHKEMTKEMTSLVNQLQQLQPELARLAGQGPGR